MYAKVSKEGESFFVSDARFVGTLDSGRTVVVTVIKNGLHFHPDKGSTQMVIFPDSLNLRDSEGELFTISPIHEVPAAAAVEKPATRDLPKQGTLFAPGLDGLTATT